MRVLIVGGACQGKRRYAENAYGGVTIDRMHREVRRLMEQKEDARAFFLEELDGMEDWVVLCDEIGLGVIPEDSATRRWREEVGRLCCELARRADVVERVCCGIPLRLKGDK